MRLLALLLAITSVCVTARGGQKAALTESLGQEVIEIGTPIKELPPNLEEEPSAESDEDVPSKPTSTTKKDTKKVTVKFETRKKVKDIDIIDGRQEDEEARIEKELAEVYKDTSDYNSGESGSASKRLMTSTEAEQSSNETEMKDVARRQQEGFKFQPDVHNKKEIEKFRTMVDDIKCDRRVTNKMELSDKNSSSKQALAYQWIYLTLLSYIFY